MTTAGVVTVVEASACIGPLPALATESNRLEV